MTSSQSDIIFEKKNCSKTKENVIPVHVYREFNDFDVEYGVFSFVRQDFLNIITLFSEQFISSSYPIL